ncbi:MAG: tetratricopeptide repeat protein [Nocardioidaceae bacterium]
MRARAGSPAQAHAGVDASRARAGAAEQPDDVASQTLVADLDLLGGDVDEAFSRLIELVRRSAGDERDAARKHLVEMFNVVGDEDPRVLKARQSLANALF